MRDRQVEIPTGQARIPLVSALLHCVSMSVLVYLRSSFGFVYLRSKSVFFAFSWALLLFTIYAWNEPPVWQEYRFVCVFGIGSVALYWFHLTISFVRELNRKGEHDRYSGRSHPFRLMRLWGSVATPRAEMIQHLWVEPAAVLISAVVIRIMFGDTHLSLWLLFAAVCLWVKEALNYWHQLRQQKRQEDIFSDTEDSVADTSPNTPNFEPPVAARKARVKRQRSSGEGQATERRFAELLRLFPPYSLEMAEEHYRALIKEEHPDNHGDSAESTARTADLNAAVEHFRQALDRQLPRR